MTKISKLSKDNFFATNFVVFASTVSLPSLILDFYCKYAQEKGRVEGLARRHHMELRWLEVWMGKSIIIYSLHLVINLQEIYNSRRNFGKLERIILCLFLVFKSFSTSIINPIDEYTRTFWIRFLTKAWRLRKLFSMILS